MASIPVQHLSPGSFARFGRVVQPPAAPPLARTPQFAFWSDVAHYHIEGETEIGLCTAYRPPGGAVTWMERHARTPELLVPIDVPFVLPVMDEEGGRVEAFRVDPGEAVVIGQGIWHSACHPAEADEATYFVIFRRGTPHEDVTKTEIGAVVIGAGAA